MQEVSKGGRTVLFVSHQLGVVRQLCQRVLLLTAGSVVLDGLPSLVIDNYLSQAAQGIQGGHFVRSGVKPVDSVFYVNRVTVSDNLSADVRTDFESDETIVIRICYTADRVVKALYGYITLQRSDGTLVYEGDSFDTIPNPFESMKPGEGGFTITIPMHLLAPGKYLVYLSFASNQDPAGFEIDVPGIVGEFRVSDNHSRRGNHRQGFLSSRFDWQLAEP
jgi:lipopolysaccharide transport system ATP-binding protein